MTQPNQSADQGNAGEAKGHHSGYAEAGTILLQGGERIAADPVSLEPLPEPEETPNPKALPESTPEKAKPASKSTEKPATDPKPAE